MTGQVFACITSASHSAINIKKMVGALHLYLNDS
jgi:hypothetical protein